MIPACAPTSHLDINSKQTIDLVITNHNIGSQCTSESDSECLLTCKVFYIHVGPLTNELLDAPCLAADRRSVEPCLAPLVALVHLVFGFGCRVWRSLLAQA